MKGLEAGSGRDLADIEMPVQFSAFLKSKKASAGTRMPAGRPRLL